MRLKYYLRGLGIGILITVIVLAIASSGKKELTDEEIIARAEELGMVKKEKTGSILDSLQDTPQEGAAQDPNGDSLESGEDGSPDGSQEGNEDGNVPENPTSDPEPDQQRPNVSIEVGQGEYSDRISDKLLQAGLIDNAEAFNRYLVDSGIDGLISVGTYQIPQGASYEEIAKILSEEPQAQ